MFVLIWIYLYDAVNAGTTAKATWYDGGDASGGACGYDGVNTASFPFGYFVAVGSDNFDDGYQCGACYSVTCVSAHSSDSGNGCGCITYDPIIVQVMDWFVFSNT